MTARAGWESVLLRAAAAVAVMMATRAGVGQALPTGTGPGMYVIVGGTVAEFQSDYGQQKITGGAVYVDSNLFWRYGIETEARRIVYPSFGERQTTLLGGPRYSFRAKGLVPYVKLLAGGGRFDFPYGYGHGDYFVAAPGAGLDLRLGERVRVRLADFEYQVWPGFSFGALHPYGVSAGVSFQVLGADRTRMSR